MGDSMAVCVYSHFLSTVEDMSIRPILEDSLQASKNHLAAIGGFLEEAQFQIPVGFTEKDVQLQAPRLFSDPFYLFYSYIMTVHGLTSYSLALSCCDREDIQNYFMDCITSAKKLFQTITVLAKTKPKFMAIPPVPSPEGIEFIRTTGILANLVGHKSPLNVSEIGNLLFNAKKTGFVRTLSLGFGQVAEHKQVREFMQKNVKLSGKDTDSFDTLLQQDDLAAPPRWDDEITDSIASPFSDKLMMFHCAFLINAALSYYGAALGSSLRSDVILNYKHAFNHAMEAGAICYDIMVDHSWMEKQPEAIDRKKLSQV